MERFELPTCYFVDSRSIHLSYIHILAGVVGFEPTNDGVRDRGLTAWLHPNIMVIRAGLEPSITALQGLCPDHLDERTIW